ncbi:hypothetical protein M3193_11325 [Sporosarcina luteola]|uniref:hypothetical protein n=1 Tax=Sporosarcina luteola TaxID=582850 RepID=UPI00204146EF|nr:hypothetical protein [Sporosarcina luteola]MCM3744736.1 hypothetical protein [Sporosarcina luteola]
MKSLSGYTLHFVLLLVPFVYGFFVNVMVIPLFPFIMQFVLLVFWFYVGAQFSKLDMPVWKSFMMGNSVWLISFILFVWQFVVLDGASRSMDLAMLSQHYMLAFVYGAARMLPFLSNGTTIMFCAYILMLITFTFGFLVMKRRSYGITVVPKQSIE